MERMIPIELSAFFPFWESLAPEQRAALEDAAVARTAPRGAVLHTDSDECTGLLLVRSGQLRALILSDAGREITLYRLLERDVCLFSAACIMRSIQFDITVEAEKDSDYWLIPAARYQALMAESAAIANFTNALMASRFSDVVWLLDQILWKRFDQRLAALLLEEAALEGSHRLALTHDAISRHLGSAREVVTRMLNYFQDEGVVRLSRGHVELLDPDRLARLRDE